MKTKVLEQYADSQLNKALTHMNQAALRLKQASASVDDFPTARHELSDLASAAEAIEQQIQSLKSKLDQIKTK